MEKIAHFMNSYYFDKIEIEVFNYKWVSKKRIKVWGNLWFSVLTSAKVILDTQKKWTSPGDINTDTRN